MRLRGSSAGRRRKAHVADGLKIEALATASSTALGLRSPQRRTSWWSNRGSLGPIRSTARRIWSCAGLSPGSLSAGDTGASNRITLLRNADGDGKPETQKRLPRSPQLAFGVALVGTTSMSPIPMRSFAIPTRRAYEITAPGTVLTALPAAPSTTTGPRAWCKPGRFAPLRRRRLQQQHHRKRHGGEMNAPPSGRSRGNRPLAIFASGLRIPTA